MDNYLIYCDVDEQGNIIDAFYGTNIIPSRQYDYYFFTEDKDIANNLMKYYVNIETRQLTLRP